jgi:hypothetical protein
MTIEYHRTNCWTSRLALSDDWSRVDEVAEFYHSAAYPNGEGTCSVHSFLDVFGEKESDELLWAAILEDVECSDSSE